MPGVSLLIPSLSSGASLTLIVASAGRRRHRCWCVSSRMSSTCIRRWSSSLRGQMISPGTPAPSTPAMIEDNFRAMTAIARQNGIKVVLASITPAFSYPWKPGIEPVATIREVNGWLSDFCAVQKFVYLDYYSALVDEKGAMKPGLSKDGVHPTAAGYAIMAPLAEAAIAKALAK